MKVNKKGLLFNEHSFKNLNKNLNTDQEDYFEHLILFCAILEPINHFETECIFNLNNYAAEYPVNPTHNCKVIL